MTTLIKPDHNRRIDIPGVPGPVSRPVDIDPSKTGFSNLRTLRIYRFDKDSVIEGHAEEDEVFIVVLSGAIELTAIEDPLGPPPDSIILTALDGTQAGLACAAYLPRHAAYKLVPRCDADVAYARATPSGRRSPRSFIAGSDVFLEETSHAERLRFRLTLLRKRDSQVSFIPVKQSEALCEALVHVQSVPPNAVSATAASDGTPFPLDSWDTIALGSGENLTLTIAPGSAALVFVVMAL